jgi:hypothetical protein
MWNVKSNIHQLHSSSFRICDRTTATNDEDSGSGSNNLLKGNYLMGWWKWKVNMDMEYGMEYYEPGTLTRVRQLQI